jgi:hypothetical protein
MTHLTTAQRLHLRLAVGIGVLLAAVIGFLLMPGAPVPSQIKGIPIPFGSTNNSSFRGAFTNLGTTADKRKIVDMSFEDKDSELFGMNDLTFVLTSEVAETFSDGAPLSVALTAGKRLYGYRYKSKNASEEIAMLTLKNNPDNSTKYEYSQLFPGTFFASDASLADQAFVDGFAAKGITFLPLKDVTLDANARYLIIAEEAGISMTVRGLTLASDSCQPTKFSPHSVMPWVLTGDMDNDGDSDVVEVGQTRSGHGADRITVFLNQGDGTFLSGKDYAPGGEYHGALLKDVNEDGFPDVILLNNLTIINGVAGRANITILTNTGNGVLAYPRIIFFDTTDPFVHPIAVGDVNDDGIVDIYAGYNVLEIFLGADNFTFPDNKILLGNGSLPNLIDLDRDGDLDAVHVNGGAINVFMNRGKDAPSLFEPSVSYTQQTNTPSLSEQVFLDGDLTGDGFSDFLYQTVQGSMTVWVNNGDGTLTKHMQSVDGPKLGSNSALADFNGDGNLDLLSNTPFSAGYEYREGNGDGTFSAPVTIPTPATTNKMAVVDLNGDGRPDVMQPLLRFPNGDVETHILWNKCFFGQEISAP